MGRPDGLLAVALCVTPAGLPTRPPVPQRPDSCANQTTPLNALIPTPTHSPTPTQSPTPTHPPTPLTAARGRAPLAAPRSPPPPAPRSPLPAGGRCARCPLAWRWARSRRRLHARGWFGRQAAQGRSGRACSSSWAPQRCVALLSCPFSRTKQAYATHPPKPEPTRTIFHGVNAGGGGEDKGAGAVPQAQRRLDLRHIICTAGRQAGRRRRHVSGDGQITRCSICAGSAGVERSGSLPGIQPATHPPTYQRCRWAAQQM